MDMNNLDQYLYSRGKYWLLEHWNEARTNIYSKAKCETFEQVINGLDKHLTEDHKAELLEKKRLVVDLADGTALFFKYVDL